MEFKILGPFEVSNDRGAVALGGVKSRTLLAVLLLNANEPVSAERLAQAMWGEDAPPGAVKAVQVHVSRLRKALGDGNVVETTRAGYCLRVRPGELDAEHFEQLVEDGRHALAAGHAEQAAALLREALTLWRGTPLAELAFEPFAQAEIARLDEQRLTAMEARVEADLAAGREAELIGELQQLVAAHPTRERLAGQLMLALYRCGRQAEALEAYSDARRVLVAEIGVEPGPELRRLQEAILRQDASLEPELPVADLPRELDAAAAPPLEGRRGELGWLRERWEQARTGSGVVVTVHGEHGIGKSRLAAELAGETHAAGAAVVYAAGTGPADGVLGALVRACEATRPTLVVIDDADRADDDARAGLVATPRAVGEKPVLVLVLSGEDDPGALARLPPDGSLLLQALDVEAVHAIAVRYAPGHVGEEVPAEWLLEASGGVPLRVHELASQWARREAARRVGAVAEQTAAGRAELRTMEDELAVGVVDLQAAGEHLALVTDDDAPVVCPFKGLASFDVADAPYFFGREQLVAELVARLVGAPLLGVVGPSGSGKSSVVRAGLLPALAGGVLPDSGHWTQVLVRPGEHPLRELTDAVVGLGDRRMVIAVDQFEETFTTCRDEEERAAFIAALVRAARDPHEQCVVVIAIRADYYGRCAAYPELSSLLAANHVLVRPMQSDELRRAIELPAHRAGLRVEPELTDALVADTEEEPGALPLLSTALLELWQRRHGRRLRHADYERMGGVRAAVARLAEGAFERLDDAQRRVARSVFMRLAGEGADGAVERRRVPLAEFETNDDEAAQVVEQLADQRLLTISAGSVEVAHEALLREWPRLRGWIEEDRKGMRIHRRMTAAAQEWDRLDRDDDALYRGTPLTEAVEWRASRDPTLNQLEREFLDAGAARRKRVRAARRRRIEFAFAALVASLAVISVVAVVAIHQRRDAQRERNTSVSRELALQSEKELAVDPTLAVRLALGALDTARTDQAEAALRQATLAFHQLAVFPADALTARTAAYSPDGSRLVAGGDNGVARVWDVASRRLIGRLAAHHGALLAARFSPRGETLALGFKDGTLLVTTPSLAAAHELLSLRGKPIDGLAFSGDGKQIAVAGGDGTVRVLQADGRGKPVTLGRRRGQVFGVDISADGTRVVSAGSDGTVRLWNVSDRGPGQVLHTAARRETDVVFNPNGTLILGVGYDGRLRLWSAQTGAQVGSMKGGARELTSVAFSPDGRRFAVGGWDGVIRVWSAYGGPPVSVLRGQRSRVYDIGFGAKGDRVVSAGDDGTARTWDAGGVQSWRSPPLTDNLDFNRDGRLIVSASEDGKPRVWVAATGQLRKTMPGAKGFTTARFSPRADDVLIGRYTASSVTLWPLSADAPQLLVQLPKGRGIYLARLDRNAKRLIYADTKGRIAVRDLRSRREVILGGAPKDVYDARISPDGSHVAAATESGKLMIWRLERPAHPERVLTGHRGHVNTVAYSDDGRRIVTSGADRTVRVWDPRDGSAVVLRGHGDEVTAAIFTHEGRVLSTSADGTLRLWDPRGGDALAVLESGGGPLYDVVLSPDGHIATLGETDILVSSCDVCGNFEQVRALARSRAPQPLTPDERRRFLPTQR